MLTKKALNANNHGILTCYSDANALSALDLADISVADYRLLPKQEFEDAVKEIQYVFIFNKRTTITC
jgi:hypothetical protein